jgi:hypothetical protein
MTDPRSYVIKNVTRLPAVIDGVANGAVYEYLSQDRGVPIAFSHEEAKRLARSLNIPEDSVVPVPDDTVVILHPSARKLPQSPDVSSTIVQVGIQMQ